MKKRIDIKWDGLKPAGDSAAENLPGLARQFFEAGRIATLPDATPVQLHAFRLAAKRLRYTLEMFRPVFGPALDSRLGRLREVQQFLGSVQDCVVSVRRIRETGTPDAALEEALQRIEKRAEAKRAEFVEYWKTKLDAPGEEIHWLSYLFRYAGRSARNPRKAV